MFELPHGRFTLTAGFPEMCLEVLDGKRLRLTFQTTSDRNPVVLDGSYVVTATKMGSFHFNVTVATIKTKTLSNCRKYWIDEELPATTRLDTVIKPGSVLRFTANFGCTKSHPSVQLCLHNGGLDGKKVICRDLSNRENDCKEGPAVDGALINPPNLPARKPPPGPVNAPKNSDVSVDEEQK